MLGRGGQRVRTASRALGAVGLVVVSAAVAGYLLAEKMPVAAPPLLYESRGKIRVSEESVQIIDRQFGPLTIECRARVKNSDASAGLPA